MEFVFVESFENYIEANLVLGRLQDAGINCWLKDENTSTIIPILANAIGGIKLMVQKEDAEKALAVLQELKEEKRKAFTCPNCGSNNIEFITPSKPANWFSAIFTWSLSNYAIGVGQIWHCYNCGKEFQQPVSENNFLDDEALSSKE